MHNYDRYMAHAIGELDRSFILSDISAGQLVHHCTVCAGVLSVRYVEGTLIGAA